MCKSKQEMRVPTSSLRPILLDLPNRLAQGLSLTSGSLTAAPRKYMGFESSFWQVAKEKLGGEQWL